MPKANPIRAVVFTFIVLAFLLGTVKLFLLRFEAGDVYPAYSSLRSDPLGSRAFYKSLENINASVVSRNYQTLKNLKFKERTALFYSGIAVMDSESVSSEWLKVFDRLTDKGGRLLLSFLPIEKKPADWRMSRCARATEKVKDEKKKPIQKMGLMRLKILPGRTWSKMILILPAMMIINRGRLPAVRLRIPSTIVFH